MSVEECPYCGKSFKRLKSHLPHCKMAPVEQPQKKLQRPQDQSAPTRKQKIHKKISITQNKIIIPDERQTSKDKRKEDKVIIHKKSHRNAESSLATAEVTSVLSTESPQSKWLAKRQKEHLRLQQLSVSQKSNKPTSLSDQEEDQSFCEISNRQTHGAPQTNGKVTKAKKQLKVALLSEHVSITNSKVTAPAILKTTSLPSEWGLCHENLKFGRKVTDMEEVKPNTQSKDFNLITKVKEEKVPIFFTFKTSVWDHIKDSLYHKRSCYLLVPSPILETPKASAFENKDISAAMQQSIDLEATKVSSTPSIHLSEKFIQRPVEDVLSSRLQGFRSLGWHPEIMTAYNTILCSTESLRNSSNENMWKKHLFSGPSSHSKVPLVQRKLGDVRLNELGVWFSAQSPDSPREIVTMLNQGWQWYYRKYINLRKGGMGGISLLLTGYCVLCYIWKYPHLKNERWRKYH